MIIGLCGVQGAGKDTVGEILISNHNFIKLSFASALKDTLAVLFSWPRELLEGATEESRIWRETTNTFWAEKTGMADFTPRKALQFFGTNLLRDNFCKDIWLNIVENKINELVKTNQDINIVITDCRFLNELNFIKKSFPKALVIKINRKTENNQSNWSANHASETEWKDFNFDLELENNGSIEDLKNSVKNIIENN